MTQNNKRYILSKDDLQNLLHESIAFFSEKTRNKMELSQRIMFSDRVKWIDEFLKKMLQEYPIDDLVDKIDNILSSYPIDDLVVKIDDILSSYTGRSVDDIKNEISKKQDSYDSDLSKIKAHLKLLDENSAN